MNSSLYILWPLRWNWGGTLEKGIYTLSRVNMSNWNCFYLSKIYSGDHQVEITPWIQIQDWTFQLQLPPMSVPGCITPGSAIKREMSEPNFHHHPSQMVFVTDTWISGCPGGQVLRSESVVNALRTVMVLRVKLLEALILQVVPGGWTPVPLCGAYLVCSREQWNPTHWCHE